MILTNFKNVLAKNSSLLKLMSYIYLYINKKKKNLKFSYSVILTKSSIIEGTNTFGNNTKIISSHIGFGSYISENSVFIDSKIGKFCSIGPNVICVYGNHPTSKFVSTHPSFFSIRKQVNLTFVTENIFNEFSKQKNPKKEFSIYIGNDVWIGANVTILDGVTINDGAIIAANSLVNKDVPPYSIYGGVPAKHLKMRFEKDELDFLLKLKWWNKSIDWIKIYAPYFKDIVLLKNKVIEDKLKH